MRHQLNIQVLTPSQEVQFNDGYSVGGMLCLPCQGICHIICLSWV